MKALLVQLFSLAELDYNFGYWSIVQRFKKYG